MFPDHHYLSPPVRRTLKPDRRPLPTANEIRLRVKRTRAPKGD